MGESQLEVIAVEYQKVLDILNEAAGEVNKEEAALNTFQQAIDGFNDKASGVNAAVEAAQRKMAAARNSGFLTVYPDRILVQAIRFLDQARSLYQTKKFILAVKNLDDAADSASQAAKYTDELPQKKQEAETSIQTLASRIEQTKESITKGRIIFDRISTYLRRVLLGIDTW